MKKPSKRKASRKPREWYLLVDDSHLVQHGASKRKACAFVKHMMIAEAKHRPYSKLFWGQLRIVKVVEVLPKRRGAK